MVEAIVGAIVLGAAITLMVPMMSSIRHQRQAIRFETLAMVELNNIEVFLPEPFDGQLPGSLSDAFQRRYQNAELKSELLPESPDEGAKALQGIRLTISRPSGESRPDLQVSLVVWKLKKDASP